MRSIFFRLFIAGAISVALFPSVSLAKTYVNPLDKAVWFKYGVNPWSKDTDNDGFADVWEVLNNYCPTFPGILPLNDKQCRKGAFDLNKQTYTPPANVSFYPARAMNSVASCQSLQKVLALNVRSNPSLDEVSNQVAVYGADDPALTVTDTRAAYILTGQVVRIVSLGTDAKLVSSLKLSADGSYRPDRIYVNGTTLIAVGQTIGGRTTGEEASRLEIWDIKKLEAPQRVRTIDVAGSVIGTRVSDGSLYVALAAHSYSDEVEALDQSRGLTPVASLLKGIWFYRDLRSRVEITTVTAWKTLSACGNVEYAAPLRGRGMAQLIAVSLKYPTSAVVSKTLFGLGDGDALYFAANNLYVVSPDYNYSWLSATAEERTELFRFSLTKNRFTAAGAQTVPGTIVPGGLGEYQGKIRIATTKRKSPLTTDPNNFINAIYVLDSDLTRLVWVEGFAPYERAIDVVFAGSRFYVRTDHDEKGFVVFGHGDYFTPKLLGRVASPGSLNVRALGADTLLTLGHNELMLAVTSTVTSTAASTSTPATTTTALVSSTAYAGYGGLRLSLVNARAAENTFEFPVVIGDQGTASDALEHDTVFAIDPSKNYVAFPATEVANGKLKTPVTLPFGLVRTLSPSAAGVSSNMGIYAFALNRDFGPQFLGTVALPWGDWQYTPSPTLGMFFSNNMLYTATAHRLIITSLPSLSPVKEVQW